MARLSPSSDPIVIRTPDQRLRVFVSSTMKELAEERQAVRSAIANLHLAPVMFETGARPYPSDQLYEAYLSQSHIFIGVYWQSYGWVAPGKEISGLEDEYNLALHKPMLVYIKTPADDREPRLANMLTRIKNENGSSYKYFSTADQLRELVENDLVLVLTEYFETAAARDRPALDQPAPASTNVPVPRNSLIGRTRELAAASDLLLQQDAALVTLTGSAGAGKSRLGIQIARDLRDHFADGAYLVTLESVQDAQLVISAVAKTLGLKETSGRQSLFETLKAYLSGKQMLLLLDNFEHVLPAAPRIADLLESAPRTKILATSRAPLRIRAERELAVAPLALPPPGQALEPERLCEYAAIQLFVQRAQSVNLDFRLTPENAAAVAEICRRLDGLPLAIELAAARIKMLPPPALLVKLENEFQVLRGDTRDLPPRQRTLYEAIDWSYNLLSDADQRLLQYLSVFVGGWTLESAEEVCNVEGEEPMNVFEGLERLMNNNLLKPSEESQGELRMRQFETVRDFAREHLLRSGRAEVITERYSQYFLRLAQSAETALAQPSHASWHARLEAELDNLRAVMRSAIETGRSDQALRIATALWRFWWRYGHWNEGLESLKAGAHAGNALPPGLKAEALTQAGWLCRFMGDFPQSIALLQESLALWQQTTDDHGHAMALANLGASMIRSADVERGVALTQQALELAQQHDDTAGISFSLQVLGHAASLQGNTRRALELYEGALTLALQLGDDDHCANVLNALAEVHMTEGDYEQAEACLSRAATIAARLGNRFVSTYISGNRGAIALQKGNYAQAFDLFSETLLALQEMGDRENAILCLEAFAYIANRGGLWDRAVKLLAANDALRQVVGFSHSAPMQADYDAAVAEARGQLDAQAFQAAWAEGTALAYDRAIAYAVDKSWRPAA